jgi:hypothetical protein
VRSEKMAIIDEIGLWISAFYIIASYSFLYKYNRLFKFAEHTMIGAAAGHIAVMGINNIRTVGIENILAGNYIYILAFPLGLSLFGRYTANYKWTQRYGFAFLVGVGTSIATRARVLSRVLVPLSAPINKVSLSSPADIINSIIIVVWVTSVLAYFLFTRRYTGESTAISYFQKTGRWGIVLGIGFYLGQTVMTRLAFVINRLEFLLFEWLRIPRA